jgi:ribosomal protein S18 acetylase RimI-like enzyme
MIEVKLADKEHIPNIRQLALVVFPHTYQFINTPGQVSYMLDRMYSEEALQEQMDCGHVFFLVYFNGDPYGYASVGKESDASAVWKLHKIYILPEAQKLGLGKALLETAERYVKSQGAEELQLNVNRNNPALGFYQKAGYEILLSEDIPYGEYILDDYRMGKRFK